MGCPLNAMTRVMSSLQQLSSYQIQEKDCSNKTLLYVQTGNISLQCKDLCCTQCLNEGHQFQVKNQDLGQLQNLGSTDHTNIQGLFLPKRLWSLQAHPEFNATALDQILEFAKPKLSNEEYQSATERNTGNVEQQVALDSLVNFVLE